MRGSGGGVCVCVRERERRVCVCVIYLCRRQVWPEFRRVHKDNEAVFIARRRLCSVEVRL